MLLKLVLLQLNPAIGGFTANCDKVPVRRRGTKLK